MSKLELKYKGGQIFSPSCLLHPASPCLHLYEEATLYSKQRVCSGHGMRNYCQNNSSKKHLVSGVLAGHLAETATDSTFSPFQKQNGFVTSILYKLNQLNSQNKSRIISETRIFPDVSLKELFFALERVTRYTQGRIICW